MGRIAKSWICVGFFCAGACDEGIDEGPGARQRGADIGACEDLGYAGTCLGEVSVWFEDRACRVRDCGGEGKTCGWISDSVGWGCLEGTQGSTAFWCEDVGYEGVCLSGDVLVWTEDASCRWADCAARGQRCGWTDSVGYDCVDGEPEPGPGPAGGEFVVAGVRLEGNRARWVRHIAEEIVPRMIGSRSDRIDKAAVVTWWSLKEGVLDLDDPLSYSNCHFPPDQRIGPVDVCPNPDNAWQVGIAAVQAAWRSLADVEALAASVHPGQSTKEILEGAAATAGFGPDSAVGQTVAGSTGRLRLSWLLRDGPVGFEAEYPVVRNECFVESRSWCFGSGWDTSATFAPDRWTSEQAIADLRSIFSGAGEGEISPPASGDVLTIGEIVGGQYGVSQDYGPTDFDYNYDYCQAYGDWGGQHVHCGADISIPHGTPLFVPADGTVLIAGESPFFEDVVNAAAGELKIRFDHDGAESGTGRYVSEVAK